MTTCAVCEVHAESVFRIEGMDCHEEVTILEQRLKRLAGLEALDADVVGQRLNVKYDAARLTTSHIAEAVAQTGMRAWLEHEAPRPVPGSHAWRTRLIAVSAVSLAAGLALELTVSGRGWSAPAFALAIVTGGATARRAGCRAGRRPRHLRPDAGGGGGCGRAGAMVRRRIGRLPVRSGAAARGERDGARTRGHPGADGPGASDGARQARRWSSCSPWTSGSVTS
jgi:copper chaperone CopZ